MKRNHEQTALITGASRGFGRALAHALAVRGWRLVIDGRDRETLEGTAREVGRLTEVRAVVGDVTDPAHHEELAEAVRSLGLLDLLVNNASTLGASPQPFLLEAPQPMVEAVFRTNLLAPLALIQVLSLHFAPKVQIVNVTSDAAVEAYAGWGAYGSSKAALEQMSAILAVERPEWRVYRFDPGDMRTRMHQEAFPGEDIGDRPLPEARVPALLRLLEEDLPSGRYTAAEMAVASEGGDA
ncbi:MAG: SDR family NAD(P)-dependent oxidoreductase [Deltaproteobacteria bacterium]|nr:MAG: SDR family NAD(P)-dependent oxidoreductase [Deltaproteobacteria bacterium]